jgi:hypothetical protein
MITGVSAKIKDKRISKYLEKKGYNLAECEIFYSPITGFLFYLVILIAFTIPLWFYFPLLISKYPYFFLIYFIVQYLALAFLNNSYVISQHKLIVINPNFPFKKVKVYEFAEIDKIKIDDSGLALITWVLLIFYCNYIEIYTADKTQRFYSIFLEVDYFDENITEKTLDDFNTTLCKHNIVTEFNL